MSKKTKNVVNETAPETPIHTPRLDGPEADAFDAAADAKDEEYAAEAPIEAVEVTAGLDAELAPDKVMPKAKSKVSKKSATKASLKTAKAARTETRKAAKDDPKLPKWKGATLLPDVCDGYLASIEEGMTPASFLTYKRILALACEELGPKTDVASISTKRVLGYLTGDALTRKKSGAAKSHHSVNQHRRVVRHMLLWAERVGIVEKAPVPELEAATV